ILINLSNIRKPHAEESKPFKEGFDSFIHGIAAAITYAGVYHVLGLTSMGLAGLGILTAVNAGYVYHKYFAKGEALRPHLAGYASAFVTFAVLLKYLIPLYIGSSTALPILGLISSLPIIFMGVMQIVGQAQLLKETAPSLLKAPGEDLRREGEKGRLEKASTIADYLYKVNLFSLRGIAFAGTSAAALFGSMWGLITTGNFMVLVYLGAVIAVVAPITLWVIFSPKTEGVARALEDVFRPKNMVVGLGTLTTASIAFGSVAAGATFTSQAVQVGNLAERVAETEIASPEVRRAVAREVRKALFGVGAETRPARYGMLNRIAQGVKEAAEYAKLSTKSGKAKLRSRDEKRLAELEKTKAAWQGTDALSGALLEARAIPMFDSRIAKLEKKAASGRAGDKEKIELERLRIQRSEIESKLGLESARYRKQILKAAEKSKEIRNALARTELEIRNYEEDNNLTGSRSGVLALDEQSAEFKAATKALPSAAIGGGSPKKEITTLQAVLKAAGYWKDDDYEQEESDSLKQELATLKLWNVLRKRAINRRLGQIEEKEEFGKKTMAAIAAYRKMNPLAGGGPDRIEANELKAMRDEAIRRMEAQVRAKKKDLAREEQAVGSLKDLAEKDIDDPAKITAEEKKVSAGLAAVRKSIKEGEYKRASREDERLDRIAVARGDSMERVALGRGERELEFDRTSRPEKFAGEFATRQREIDLRKAELDLRDLPAKTNEALVREFKKHAEALGYIEVSSFDIFQTLFGGASSGLPPDALKEMQGLAGGAKGTGDKGSLRQDAIRLLQEESDVKEMAGEKYILGPRTLTALKQRLESHLRDEVVLRNAEIALARDPKDSEAIQIKKKITEAREAHTKKLNERRQSLNKIRASIEARSLRGRFSSFMVSAARFIYSVPVIGLSIGRAAGLEQPPSPPAEVPETPPEPQAPVQAAAPVEAPIPSPEEAQPVMPAAPVEPVAPVPATPPPAPEEVAKPTGLFGQFLSQDVKLQAFFNNPENAVLRNSLARNLASYTYEGAGGKVYVEHGERSSDKAPLTIEQYGAAWSIALTGLPKASIEALNSRDNEAYRKALTYFI
ncbi:MAG: hypothetical protein Q8Q87_04830, partial [Candidatus Omnitrophota bacterium]|nr:hypothetical protein [Candidatus Omnitrophota bacterium]